MLLASQSLGCEKKFWLFLRCEGAVKISDCQRVQLGDCKVQSKISDCQRVSRTASSKMQSVLLLLALAVVVALG